MVKILGDFIVKFQCITSKNENFVNFPWKNFAKKIQKFALKIQKPFLEKTKVIVTHPMEINVIRIDEMLMHFNL